MPLKSRAAANLLKAKPARQTRQPRKGRGFRRLSLRGMAVFLLVLVFGSVGIIGFLSGAAAGRIADGVSAGPVVIGGMTPTEAATALGQRLADYRLRFQADGVDADFNPISALDREGRAIASIDVDDAVKRAYAVGRDGRSWMAALERADAYLLGKDVGLPFQVNRKALEAELKVRFAGVFSPAVDARLVVSVDSAGRTRTEIVPERPGTNLDTDRAAVQAESRLADLSDDKVVVSVKHDEPQITAATAGAEAAAAEAAVSRGPLTLTAKKTSWTVTKRQLAGWLDVVIRDDGSIGLGFDRTALEKYLDSKAPAFKIAPVDAVFEQKEGKVTRLEPQQNGEGLDIDGSVAALEKAVFGPKETAAADGGEAAATEKATAGMETGAEGATDASADGTQVATGDGESAVATAAIPKDDATVVVLPIKIVEPKITTEKSNPYGVKDVLGVGSSNFKGSPKNRITNIGVGADSLNGLVIPADTEFSLVKALGPIDGDHGYKQELVIKKDKTTPEYGGGLCQIGTTTFRTAMASALPVTERRNHSYRVVYYERDGDGKMMGPGKDATIYDPWPDFKFKNDTGHPIIIMTDISGTKLSFTFWGVSDGRTAEQTNAVVSNIVQPPEKKTVPSPDLPPGKEKCTETPHAGADAVFTYTITYADGKEDKQRFYSHYKPWGEVCLVGVDPNAAPLPTDAAAGTVISADASGASGN